MPVNPATQQQIANGPHVWSAEKGYQPSQPAKQEYPKWVNGVLCKTPQDEARIQPKRPQAPTAAK